MILTCPSCATRYFADDAAIGPAGRTVRCASCQHSWFAEPHLVLDQAAPDDLLPGAEPAKGKARAPLTREQVERMRRGLQPEAPQSAAARIRAQQADRERKARMRAAAAAWGGAGAVAAASVVGAAIFREDVARIWPKTASAFAAVGLPVNIYGLEFTELDIEKTFDGPTPVLSVAGAIRNIGPEMKAAPALRFSLRDERGGEVYRWVERLEGQRIEPGAALPFQTMVPNPPSHAVDLEATFASAAEAAAAAPARPTGEPAAPLDLETPALPEELGKDAEPAGDIHGEAAFIAPASLGFGPRDDISPRLIAAQLGVAGRESY
jgi:predicted Zn finger-like uncharacterized protein